jgi:hypothetical protein
MTGTPIVVHRISPAGSRRVTVRDQIMGLAHYDRDLLEFLRQTGLPDAEDLLRAHAFTPRSGEVRGGGHRRR